ncbi:MAG: hypothetical protein ACOX2F_10875 [bacterium]
METKLFVFISLICGWFLVSGQALPSNSSFASTVVGYDFDEEDEHFDEREDFAEKEDEEDEFAPEAEREEDDFVADDFKDVQRKDDFETDDFKESHEIDEFAPSEDDDFVVEKREKGKTHRYVEPELAKVTTPSYLYSEGSIKSKKLFELYRNDEVVVLQEGADFMRVEFLGKEGWVPSQDVKIEKWHSYRLSMELSGGVAGGGGEIKNFNIIGNYLFRINVAVIQDFVIGAEARGLSFDADAMYAGGGLMLRYYIHGVRSKKTRSAISVSAGYIGGYERKGESYGLVIGESPYMVFNGAYVGGSVDYFFRAFEYMSIGIGADFTYVKLFGETDSAKLQKEFYQGGGHLSISFNILR